MSISRTRALPSLRGDLAAAVLALLCAIHCAAAPLLVGLAPALYGSSVEWGACIALCAVSLAVLVRGWLRHRAPWALGAFAVGTALLFAPRLGVLPEGAALLAVTTLAFLVAHALNVRCSATGCCDCAGPDEVA